MTTVYDPELPEAGDGACCWGAMNGPGGCTCWRPVHDLDQTDPDPQTVRLLAAGVTPSVRDRMCGDCAYRPGSPEKLGDPQHRGGPEFLEELAATDRAFFCHDGMRRITARQHPAGVDIPGHAAAYDPPIVAGVPYRADGQAGLLCAGWDARRRAIAAGATR